MSIIIRLQNLPLEANSLDIRRFFQGLHIPDGGVHIVGGANGDAFIAFGGDEDARQAMERNGNMIKTSRIKLLLSSRNEMQRVIDNARNATTAGANSAPPGGPVKPPSVPMPGPGAQGPVNAQYQGHPGQYPQSAVPLAAAQNLAPKPMGVGPANSYGQVYPGSQGAPAPLQTGVNSGYGITPPPQHQQARGQPPLDASYGRNAPYRSRSRSRSPPPIRGQRDLVNDPMMAPSHGSMASGLMGAIPQAPPQQAAPIQQQQAYPPNGQNYPTPTNAHNGGGGGPPAPQQQPQGPYDNGNYYSRPNYPQNGPPGVGAPNYGGGGGDDRWSEQGGPPLAGNTGPSPMMGGAQGQMGQADTYQQNAMYRNQAMPPYHHQQQQQQPQGQVPPSHSPFSGGQQMYGNNNSNPSPMPMGGPGGQGGAPPPPPMHHHPSPGRMFTVQTWNLPPNVRSGDLIHFFTPLYLLEENVKIFYDERGLPTGMAFVTFANAREFDSALGYNGRYMHDRQVQIRPLDDGPSNGGGAPPQANMQQHQPPPPMQHNEQPPFIDQHYQPGFRSSPGPTPDIPYTNNRGPPPSSMNGGGPGGQHFGPPPPPQGPNKELVLYMKGLPFTNCTPKDVEEFFQPIPLANIEIERDPRGKPSGNAFAEFDNRLDYSRAMSYNMRHMGSRYIELIPLLKLEKLSTRGKGGPPPHHCISVKGLSPNVSSADLKHYFGAAGARPFAVHIMLTAHQMNAGEAFLEFADKESQKRALKQDNDIIGQDRITVRPVPYDVVLSVIQGREMGAGGPPPPQEFAREGGGAPGKGGRNRDKRGGGGQGGLPPFQDRGAILLALDCPPKATEEDFSAFFEKFKITPDRVKSQMSPSGSIDTQISFYSKADADHARRIMDNKHFLGRNIRLEFL